MTNPADELRRQAIERARREREEDSKENMDIKEKRKNTDGDAPSKRTRHH